ncbi:transglycosylase SLT domain-containing protein [Streptomyces sp. NPDC048639]|uniref:transglycosylase SLT domain-containing protein n=1 Tax=Streptomyces sp. NPDC048639 TaxID=3365581 RepID=UPI003711430A
MPVPTFSGYRRLTKTHKLSAAGVAAAGAAAALAFSVVPGSAEAEQPESSQALSAKPVAELQADSVGKIQKDTATQKSAEAAKKAKAEAEKKKLADLAAKQKKAAADMAKKKAAFAEKAKKERAAKDTANRSQARAAAPAKSYPNNLDGWIRESLDIMKKNNIPGSYEGIHRNIIRESGGNPNAINNWDVNAQNGVPSIGLLQVIKPTFDQYHVEGTKNSQYDPVANIVAACNYAADRYGSMDNVDSAY